MALSPPSPPSLPHLSEDELLKLARDTLRLEAEAIQSMAERLDNRFAQAVNLIYACHGRVVVTGMGKSGLIGKKVAATLASTGTLAFFLHPAEGIHGDLGMVNRDDILLALSNSGETEEVLTLLPVIQRLGAGVIALVGRMDSTLARLSDVALDTSVAREACPMGLAPTTSTTAALAMGDALAVALLKQRGFSPEQFALIHPGGSLGKKLLLRVADLMHRGAEIPLVTTTDTMRTALVEMTAKRMGLTGVTEHGQLAGVITDGDLRRWLERDMDLLNRAAGEVMTRNPRTIRADTLAAVALRRMEEHKITSLFVRDEDDALTGVVHLHDILAAGVA